ncbi:MAG: type II toxin-antitoxin system PemK/MazF family toxin [Flavobacterium sp.]|nr:MAG: type II toxin-antitoxin system PemK/MazF family toxin [Flavobacterium sp.]
MIKQYEIYWINFDPTVGAEIGKKRPALIISPNEMNDNLKNVTVAAITSTSKGYPTRVDINHLKNVKGEIVLDQVRTLDKSRIISSPIDILDDDTIKKVKSILYEIFIQ